MTQTLLDPKVLKKAVVIMTTSLPRIEFPLVESFFYKHYMENRNRETSPKFKEIPWEEEE